MTPKQRAQWYATLATQGVDDQAYRGDRELCDCIGCPKCKEGDPKHPCCEVMRSWGMAPETTIKIAHKLGWEYAHERGLCKKCWDFWNWEYEGFMEEHHGEAPLAIEDGSTTDPTSTASSSMAPPPWLAQLMTTVQDLQAQVAQLSSEVADLRAGGKGHKGDKGDKGGKGDL